MNDDTPAPKRRTRMPQFKRLLPRGLFGRTLLIIVLPMLITLAAATFVFFDRHWYTVTNRMSYALAGDVATVVELMHDSTTAEGKAAIEDLAAAKMDLTVDYTPGATLPKKSHKRINPLRDILNDALDDRMRYPYDIDMRAAPEMIGISVQTPEGVYVVLSPERRVYTPTTAAFIAWMIGTALLLSAIALLFMRNQIRPIRRLADAAEAIGKGRYVPWFKAEGASEVRQAAAALMVMRDRLRRQITQRTAMLAGVSHDLRTPLTRMKLQLALMPETVETKEIAADIAEMETMLEAYLAFARGEESEPEAEIDLAVLLEEVVVAARKQNPNIKLTAPADTKVTLRRNAMKRCLANLIGNAVRYGKSAEVNTVLRDEAVDITIDDDGPGIDPAMREDVFRPFLRLDESRNPATGGVGLGLTIARDIARFHGGDVVLEDSPLGGLRARLWLPV